MLTLLNYSSCERQDNRKHRFSRFNLQNDFTPTPKLWLTLIIFFITLPLSSVVFSQSGDAMLSGLEREIIMDTESLTRLERSRLRKINSNIERDVRKGLSQAISRAERAQTRAGQALKQAKANGTDIAKAQGHFLKTTRELAQLRSGTHKSISKIRANAIQRHIKNAGKRFRASDSGKKIIGILQKSKRLLKFGVFGILIVVGTDALADNDVLEDDDSPIRKIYEAKRDQDCEKINSLLNNGKKNLDIAILKYLSDRGINAAIAQDIADKIITVAVGFKDKCDKQRQISFKSTSFDLDTLLDTGVKPLDRRSIATDKASIGDVSQSFSRDSFSAPSQLNELTPTVNRSNFQPRTNIISTPKLQLQRDSQRLLGNQ